MALRDRLAAAALTGLMANPSLSGLDDDEIAECCYASADAMLRARLAGGKSSDSLVSRLREWATADSEDLVSPTRILLIAANEIERLRRKAFRRRVSQ
jgi:hypothetical protein